MPDTKQTKNCYQEKKQNMQGMHRHQAKRKEGARTKACERMLLNMTVTERNFSSPEFLIWSSLHLVYAFPSVS